MYLSPHRAMRTCPCFKKFTANDKNPFTTGHAETHPAVT